MPAISTSCVHCGREFTGRPDRMYCRPACRKAAHRLRDRARVLEVRRHREQQLLLMAERDGRRISAVTHRARLARIDAELDEIVSRQSSLKVSRESADSDRLHGHDGDQVFTINARAMK